MGGVDLLKKDGGGTSLLRRGGKMVLEGTCGAHH